MALNFAEVENDHTLWRKFGGGKVIRDGSSQTEARELLIYYYKRLDIIWHFKADVGEAPRLVAPRYQDGISIQI